MKKPKIIVCGLGQTGYKIFCLLRQQGADVVGISEKPVPGEGNDLILGDCASVSTLLAAKIQDAHTLVIAGSDDAKNLAVLMQARILNPKIRIINRLFNTSLGDRLNSTLPDHTAMSVSALAAPVFAFAALGNRAIGQLHLYGQTWPMSEEYITEDHPWKHSLLRDLWDDRDRMLIYYLPARSQTDLISAIAQEQRLEVGDRLIVAAKPNIRATRRTWRYRWNKFWERVQRFQEHGSSTLIVVLSLLGTIGIASLTYCWVNWNISLVDALYFSVGMITGAGGNEKVAEGASDAIKVFTVAMMLLGTGIIGICYALLNDYVLGTRFRKLLESTPIPKQHHYIVCGLGSLGIRILKELRDRGYEVVAIEQDVNSRFLNTARSLKIPVIQADATLPNTLEAANIQGCQALLAVTSDDAVNLEIALSAKGLAPKLPVVVRSQDARLAMMMQQVFEFDAVLSPTEIVAPSFAAAALGGRIFGNGMTAGSLWVALATLITPTHPFCGFRIRDAAMGADFVPLYIESNRRTVHGWQLLEFILNPGDVLYMTMPANRLQLLWRASSSRLLAS